ncbi:MAG: hypothetical protein NZ519_13125 [Bacteroidia bacterium]|nr:hypothetical protein [Bacteroidia bacterium]
MTWFPSYKIFLEAFEITPEDVKRFKELIQQPREGTAEKLRQAFSQIKEEIEAMPEETLADRERKRTKMNALIRAVLVMATIPNFKISYDNKEKVFYIKSVKRGDDWQLVIDPNKVHKVFLQRGKDASDDKPFWSTTAQANILGYKMKSGVTFYDSVYSMIMTALDRAGLIPRDAVKIADLSEWEKMKQDMLQEIEKKQSKLPSSSRRFKK